MVKMVETVHDLLSASNDYNDMIFTAKSGSSFFFSRWAIYCCVTANMKVIKTQGKPNPRYFPMESLGEDVQCGRTY